MAKLNIPYVVPLRSENGSFRIVTRSGPWGYFLDTRADRDNEITWMIDPFPQAGRRPMSGRLQVALFTTAPSGNTLT